jgi:chromodomain-helicase-DNA-binding protein 1
VSSGLETLSTPLEVSEPLEFRALLGAQEQRALIAAPEGDPEEAEQDEDEDEDEEGDEDEDAGDEDEDDDEEDADGEEKA